MSFSPSPLSIGDINSIFSYLAPDTCKAVEVRSADGEVLSGSKMQCNGRPAEGC